MPTFTRCEPAKARYYGGLQEQRGGAVMEFHRDIGRIPQSMQSTKLESVAQAAWTYRRGPAGKGLVKAGDAKPYSRR